jgi:hypothetical protein
VGAQIEHRVPGIAQLLRDRGLEVESGMVAGDGDRSVCHGASVEREDARMDTTVRVARTTRRYPS